MADPFRPATLPLNYDAISPEMISIAGLIHRIALEPRWAGNLVHHYSVAQHCRLVAQMVKRPEARIHALLHDLPEGITRDIPDPLKQWCVREGADLIGLEHRILIAIRDKLGLPAPSSDAAKEIDYADAVIRATEYRDIVLERYPGYTPELEPLKHHPIRMMGYDQAEELYRRDFEIYLRLARQRAEVA